MNHAELRAWLLHKCGDQLALDGLEQVERAQLFDWVLERVERLSDQRQDPPKVEELFYEGGVEAFVRYLDRTKDALHAPIVIGAERDRVAVDVALQ